MPLRSPRRFASASIPLVVGLAALTPALVVHGCGAAFESASGGGGEGVGPGSGGGGGAVTQASSSSSTTTTASVGAGGEGGLGSATSGGVGGSGGGGGGGGCTSSTGCGALQYCDTTGHDPPACVPCSNWDHVAFGPPARLSAGGSTDLVGYPRLSYELLQPDLWFESTSSVPSSMRQIERAPTTSAQPPAWGAPEPVTISTGNFTLLTGMGTPALVDASAITLLSSGLRGADTLFFDAVDKTIDGGTSPRHLWAGKVSFPGGNAVVSNAEEVSSLMNTELWSFTYSPAKKRAYATRGGSTPVLVEFATNGAAGTSITTVVGVRYSAPCPAAGDLAPWVRPDGEGLFFQSDNPCGGVARGTLFYQDLDGNGDGTGDAVPVLDGSFAGHTMEPSLSPDQCALVFHDTSDDRGVFYAAGRR